MSESEFQAIVDLHYVALYRFALSLVRHSADACDLTQQTFLVWARKGHTLRDRSRIKSWLFTTLYREFLQSRRSHQRVQPLDEVDETHPELLTDATAAVLKVDGESVFDALAALDEVFRAPLALFYLEEMSYNEIAETLGVPSGTVMSRLSRGKAMLRSALLSARSPSIIPFPGSQQRSAT